MSDHTWLFIAVGAYFAVLLLIGYRAFRKTSGHEGYMLANRSLPPWVAALSAGASDMSGWLIMGLPGAVYLAGLIEAWIAIGLTIGAYLNWLIVAPRLRVYTEVSRNSITVPSFFENRLRDRTHILRTVSGIIIVVFFTLYISSGMVAGGVFFESAFDGDYLTGMILVTVVTLAYTMFGGFLGASLTDVLQGLMLVIAIVALPIIAVISVGGVGEAMALVGSLSPTHFDLFGGTGATSATIIGIASGLAWGLGYFGQPHIIVRFMALRDTRDAKSARRIALGWQALSLAGAVFAGLVGVAYVAQNNIDLANPETVVLVMGQTLLHPLFAGLVLAAVLAAIMSTFSSQLIATSSALVEDLYRAFAKTRPSEKTLVLLGRSGVLLVAIVAAILALSPNDSILGLVSFAWAGFGASFGPIVILSLYWRRLTNWGAIAAMVVGAVTVFAWGAASGGIFDLYELLPGFIFATITAVLVSLATYTNNNEIQREFTETGALLVPRGK
ncbi:Proline/sodium symporter PutP (TC 2.A.21.2.1) @ Propionate/sodium symporter [Leucobacter sp. 7(1)]|uniref:sodium/proline symporter PutP n=1 Tax=Leucobacter sp. 7(1) TaxID=1255613 RepID=UPI00097EC4B0|nr:sodium/proline symporter PutP [Leucobacter sp. 7(1)]SJN10234.1 Proline/sodium symporter PutP (TC 2.A.21.2.1) @ Propionate/sodium symporter [Leucobacter sp. 7(1)]